MAIRELTRAEFQELVTDEKKRFPERHVDQKAWFASEDDQFVGVVLYDKSDDDPWCYAILRPSRKDGKYRIADSELNLLDEKDSIAKLRKSLEEHVAGKPKKKS